MKTGQLMKNTPEMLSFTEKMALQKIKASVGAHFEIQQVILFGSKARGEAQADSDIDLLFITNREITRQEKHLISDSIFLINIEYGTLFSFLAIDSEEWETGITSFMPLKATIDREGISV